MVVALVGDSKPIKPFTKEELAERLEDQKAIYDGVSSYLKQRGSQPLVTSMFATRRPAGRSTGRSAGRPAGNYAGRFTGNPAATKSAVQSAGGFMKSQPLKNLKEDGKHYANIAQGNKDNVPRPFVATTQGPSKLSPGAANSLGASKNFGAPNTFNAPKTLGETKNVTAVKSISTLKGCNVPNVYKRKVYTGPKNQEAITELRKTLSARLNTLIYHPNGEPKDPTPIGSISGPKSLNEIKSIEAFKNLCAPNPKNLGETKNVTAVKGMSAPKSLNEPKSLDTVAGLGEPMSFSTPKSPSGVNPEAKAFVPAPRSHGDSNPGLASNDDFLAHARQVLSKAHIGSMHAGPSTMAREPPVKAREPPARILLFTNVPDWLTLSDAIGFVYGGAIDCIFRSEMAEITVQFCEEAACKAYLDAHPNGIKVSNPGNPDENIIIDVEKASRGQDVLPPLQVKIGAGGSRLVRVDGMLDATTIQALTAHAMEHEVDHVEFRAEKRKTGSAYVFFCSLVDGWSFKHKLKHDEDWADYTVEFMADPCKVATAFHGNTIPNRMASAVAAA